MIVVFIERILHDWPCFLNKQNETWSSVFFKDLTGSEPPGQFYLEGNVLGVGSLSWECINRL